MSIRLTKNVASNGAYLCTLNIPKLHNAQNTKVVFTQRFINEALFSFSAIDDKELIFMTDTIILNIKEQETLYALADNWHQKEQADEKLAIMRKIAILVTDELMFRNRPKLKGGK